MTTPLRPQQPHGAAPNMQPDNRLGMAAVIVSLTFVILGFIWRITAAGWLLTAIGGILGLTLGITGYRRVRRGRAANPKTALAGIAIAVISLALSMGVIPFFEKSYRSAEPVGVVVRVEESLPVVVAPITPPGNVALGEPPPSTMPAPAPLDAEVHPELPLDPQASAFAENCKKGVSGWRPGQVDYPRRLTLNMGESASYVAAVDIRNRPFPPAQVIPAEGAQGEPVAVQCALGARLVPVGNSLGVDNTYWIIREFTPTGVANWSWSINAATPKVRDLRLELQPAVIETGGRFALPTDANLTQVSSFVTEIRVNASLIQQFGQWWKDNWNVITTVAVALAAAALSIVKLGGDVGTAMHEAVHKWRTKVNRA